MIIGSESLGMMTIYECYCLTALGAFTPLFIQIQVKVKVTLGPMKSSPILDPKLDFGYCQIVALLTMWGTLSDERTGVSFTSALTWSVGRSVKLLLAFATSVIPGFNFLEIHDQNFCSLLDIYVFRNGASFSAEWSVFLCRRYTCFTVVSARVLSALSRRPGHYGLSILCHCTILIFTQDIQRYSVNAGLCSRLMTRSSSLYRPRPGPHRKHGFQHIYCCVICQELLLPSDGSRVCLCGHMFTGR
jgi:hypothetical protein